ncbi:alpha/beta hydrolase [Kineosporia sp. J2-2]|uniref:Alpha/beta hydrolase n=1 Tax=Kineosporia corallincola TaxID=2835133 RepID=A0ABS5TNC3_9ACTN|nr:alpha/beta hydrolase [Kineosporia corallincola]MBT0772595.1 alpha/beta hydrolase [Kineosporia corallincola]
MRFTTSAGVGIEYTDTGSGPTLVLLHGLGEGGVSWHPLLPAFEAGHRVLNVTLRGHTPSDWPGEYSYQSFFSDVVELLDSLAPAPGTVLGHSLGGITAFMLAVDRPDLVNRLIVEDVAPGPPFPPRPLPDRPDREIPLDWEMVVQMRPQIDAGALDLLDRLHTITMPTLVVGGGETSHVPQAWLEEATRRIPHAELITLGGGHSVHDVLPEEFTKTVLTWLDAHPPA